MYCIKDPLGGVNIHNKNITNSSLKLGTFLIILALIASAMMVLLVLHVETDESSAQVLDSGPCGPNATYNLYSSGRLEITGSGEMYHYNTTNAPWYGSRDDITNIFISENITKLGALAFVDCKHLAELTIPITLNSVVSDKYPAFAGCCSIVKVRLTVGNGGYGYNYAAYEGSDSWYQNTPWYQSRDTLKDIYFEKDIKGIGSDAFRELKITSLVLPDTVVHLGNHCFFNCTKLTDLTIPVSLNSYGSNEKYPAFAGCMAVQKVTFTKGNGIPFDYENWYHKHKNENLAPWNLNSEVAKTMIFAEDVTELGEHMFRLCNIKELTIPVSLSCNNAAFWGKFHHLEYENLEKVTITKGTGVSIDYSEDDYESNIPWSSAPNLKTVIVEEGVTRIGSYMFHHCSMDDLILPNTLTDLGSFAVDYCTIKNLTIPISLNAVQFVDSCLDNIYAFKCVYGIEKINFTVGSGYGFDYTAYKEGNYWYRFTPWSQCEDTLKEINFAEGIIHIGSDAFRELNITSLVIPNSVESLGSHAFYNMKELSSVTIPITLDSVGSTEYPAFDQDYNIMKVRYTAGTNGIGHDYTDSVPFWNYPFYSGLTVIFDSNIKYIGTNTLSGYFFTDKEGNQLEPTAANLSGYIFWATLTPRMYLICESTTFGAGI